jgi:hypothetical protein
MRKPRLSYDPQCEELARHFLDDSDRSEAEIDIDAPKLAQQIQDAVEAFFISRAHQELGL